MEWPSHPLLVGGWGCVSMYVNLVNICVNDILACVV